MFLPDEKIIIKGVGGFYYVKTADGVLETKAKGIFRKTGITPLAGDVVELEQSGGDYVISEIHERKNSFLRPPIANIDLFILIVSAVDPAPNLMVIDKILAITEDKSVETVIALTKTDVADGSDIKKIYSSSGYRVIDIRENFQTAKVEIVNLLSGKFSVFSGNSGVGKSTLLNQIFGFTLDVGETSRKLGRGRHVTRAVELFEIVGGYIADTPGFSAVDIEHAEHIPHENLQHLFTDIYPFITKCRFRGCSHLSEKGCAVIQAVEEGDIQKSRYESYCALFKKAREIGDWEIRKTQG